MSRSRFHICIWTAVSCSLFMPGCACDTIHYNSKIRVSNASDSPANVTVILSVHNSFEDGSPAELISSTSADVPQAYTPHLANEFSIPQIDLTYDSGEIGGYGGCLVCELEISFGGRTEKSKEFRLLGLSRSEPPPKSAITQDFRINIEPAGNVNFYEVTPARVGATQPSEGRSFPVRILLTDTARAVRQALPEGLLP